MSHKRYSLLESLFEQLQVDLSTLPTLTFIEKATIQYIALIKLAMEFHERNPNVGFIVNYDRVALSPHEEMEKIFRKLNLDYSDEISSYHATLTRHGSDGSIGQHDVRRSSSDEQSKWKKELSRAEIATIEAIWSKAQVLEDKFEF
jgi:hypothetical protein